MSDAITASIAALEQEHADLTGRLATVDQALDALRKLAPERTNERTGTDLSGPSCGSQA